MSSRKLSNKPTCGGAGQSSKGKNIQRWPSGCSSIDNKGLNLNQLSRNFGIMGLVSTQDENDWAEEYDWEVFIKKPKNQIGAAKPWGPPSSGPKAWGKPETMHKLGIGHGLMGSSAGGAWQTESADARRTGAHGTVKRPSTNRAWDSTNVAERRIEKMSSRRGSNNPDSGGASQSPKGKSVQHGSFGASSVDNNGININQLTIRDHEIVWPPMIIIMNTKLVLDANAKWVGMGNQELLDDFRQYRAVQAHHSYGPQGHRGMSLLIFENTAMGYRKAERLHNHFLNEGTDREAWEKPSRKLFHPGGKRQLYGYMATKEDMESFNLYSPDKRRLNYKMQSYLEMVDKPLKEGRIVRERTPEYHNQIKEQMDSHDGWLKDAIALIHQTLDENERAFEEALQEEWKKVKEAMADSKSSGEDMLREEKMLKFIHTQEEGIKVFEADRKRLIKEYEEKKANMKWRQAEETVQLEEEFKSSLTTLMAQYAPPAL